MSTSFSSILRGAGLSTVGPVASALLSIITIKILAVSLGPAGTGFYSLLKQFVQSSAIVATLNSQGAIVQAMAARQRDDGFDLRLIAYILSGSTLLVCGVLFLAAPAVAAAFPTFDAANLAFTIRCAIPVVLMAAVGSFLAGVMNGRRMLGTLVIGQVAGAFAAALLAAPVAGWVEHAGSHVLLILLAASQIVALVVYLLQAIRLGLLSRSTWPSSRDASKQALGRFFAMSSTALVTGLTTAGTLLMVRSLIAQAHGLEGAGIFDAAYTISAGYIGLVLGGFGTYYLPTLAAMKEPAERVAFMRRMLWLTTLISVPLLAALALAQRPMISLLYSDQYAAAGELLKFMLIGDFLKTSAWTFAYLAIAFPNPRMVLAGELAWNLAFLSFSASALHFGYSLKFVGVAYLLSHAIYLLAVGIFAVRAHAFSASVLFRWTWVLCCSGLIVVAVV